MQFKSGVKIDGLNAEIALAAVVANEVWIESGRPEGVTITSAKDGKHRDDSKHYIGDAIDLRTRYFTKSKIIKVAEKLRRRLTDEFDVVIEKTHIHVEFDPKE